MDKEMKKYSKEFGKKEKVLNYACQTYQLSRPNKVGATMALIRKCQPKTIKEWEDWYFENAITEGKKSFKVTKKDIEELGERLYEKITQVVIPEWQEAFSLYGNGYLPVTCFLIRFKAEPALNHSICPSL